MTIRKEAVFNAARFDRELESTDNALPLFRDALKSGRAALREYNLQNARAAEIVQTQAWLMDRLVVRAWKRHLHLLSPTTNIALIAVGGYGRGELHPYSDVDLMFLLQKEGDDTLKTFVESLIRFLWDMGIEVGHSVRTLKDCVVEAKKDITVVTNLMEARLLHGDAALLDQMVKRTGPKKIWPSKKFFAEKWQEQINRHHHFHDTAYNLEPNIKEGPGGLRDIQMIAWVTQRQFGTRSLHDLVDHGFLTEEEHRSLIRGRNFLWQIRNCLHYMAGRREDRLVFDLQRGLATQLGYQDRKGELAVEQFMKRYYRTIKELSLLNEILLQHFQEVILTRGKPKVRSINRRFQAHGDFLEAKNSKIFERMPYAIMELFLVMAQNPKLKGVRARTIRQLRANLHLVDRNFRKDITCRSLFMELLRQPHGITHELRRMNAYGVLGAYLPAFGKIVGQMQYDLFHVYTVDEHTLFVLRNVRRFTVPEFADEFPMASQLIQEIVKPERLYIAALFHDIAKGRGGDHSELGEIEVRKFCELHDLSGYDTRLICWLVRNHLIMSWTSQHLDTNDPAVVENFARKVIDKEHLDFLYLLTVADMRGTSPKVWNAWKGSLLAELYSRTLQLLRSGFSERIDTDKRVQQAQADTLNQLRQQELSINDIESHWQRMGDSYFLRHTTDQLAWHTESILLHKGEALPLVTSRYNPDVGATEFMVFCNDRTGLFVRITDVLARQNLSIVDARLHLTDDGHVLDTFLVLDDNGNPIVRKTALKELNERIHAALIDENYKVYSGQIRIPRQLKHFPVPTSVQFSTSLTGEYNLLEIITQDRPGLLKEIAQELDANGINIASARIATYGARAEDLFFITDRNNHPVSDPHELDNVRKALYNHLDEQRLAG
jgi:[protein-PII] uridylyltransferase